MKTSCDWLEMSPFNVYKVRGGDSQSPATRTHWLSREWESLPATGPQTSVTQSTATRAPLSLNWRRAASEGTRTTHRDQDFIIWDLGFSAHCSDCVLEDPSVTCKAKHGNTEWCSPQNQKPITQLKGLLILSFKNKILYLNVIIGT